MKKSLIFFDPYPRTEDMVFPESVAREFAALGRVVTHFGSRAPAEMVERALPEVEVIVGQTAMPRDRLDRAPNLKAILNVKGNWEPNIDYAEAHRRGIHVLSAAPAMAPAVAEFCLAQAISLGRGLVAADAKFRKGTEKWGIAGNVDSCSLLGSSVGLVGFGNLGKVLWNFFARSAAASALTTLGSRIAISDITASARQPRTHPVVKPVPVSPCRRHHRK